MPPVNRNEPKRAKSSESEYSLMEFMAEFPDDATCLDWLWRNRYSTDGVHATCPKCEQERAFERYGYGTAQQRQSWTAPKCIATPLTRTSATPSRSSRIWQKSAPSEILVL